MRPSISASERAAQFFFSGDQCLYRDQHGHRVLADIEGRGHFQVISVNDSATLLLDDMPAQMFEGSYDHSLMVTDPSNGDCLIAAATGRTNPPVGPIETGQKFIGAGWVVSSDANIHIDDDHRTLPPPAPRFPYPYFRECSGENLCVIRAAETFNLIDRFTVDDMASLRDRGWRVQNASMISELTSTFADGTQNSGPVMSHLNAASWRVLTPPGCSGVMIRKLYDTFHGRQRARVLVDGNFQGWWWEPYQDRAHRWRWASFGFDFEPSAEEAVHTLTIDPPAGAPLWSVGTLEVLARMPAR
jgi:hypothetical protein